MIVDVSNPIAPTISGTYDTPGAARRVVVVGHLAYVADDHQGLQIIDVSAPNAPVRLGGYSNLGSAVDVAVIGDLAYLAYQGFGVHIVRVANPAAPVHVRQLTTPDAAVGIAVTGSTAHIALSNGLRTYDVLHPADPVTLADFTHDCATVSKVVAVDNLAYVVDRQQLRILDMTNPATPALLGTFQAPNLIRDIAVRGNLVYLGGAQMGLRVVDVTNPAVPTLLAVNGAGSIEQLKISGNYAFAACGTAGMVVFDLTTPESPAYVTAYRPVSNCDIRQMAIDGNRAYLLGTSPNRLYIADISTPAVPKPLGTYSLPTAPQAIDASGNLVCVTLDSSKLLVLDVSTPSNCTLKSTIDLPSVGQSVTLKGHLAYVAVGSAGTVVLDLLNPSLPVTAGGWDTPGVASDIMILRDIAYIADLGGGLQFYMLPPTIDGITHAGDDAYRLHLSRPLESRDYVLQVGTNIVDLQGLRMDQNQNGLRAEWNDFARAVLRVDVPLSADIRNVGAAPRYTSVDSILITFTSPVNHFDLSDLVLTVDGGANLLPGEATLTTIDRRTWTLSGLAPLTAACGVYSLALLPSDIRDDDGNPLPWVVTDQWTNLALPGGIGGGFWHDVNGDGIWDVSEKGLGGWTVFVDTNNNGSFDPGEPSVVTDSNGVHVFQNLVPGTYQVGYISKPGWFSTNHASATVMVASGETTLGIAFGQNSVLPRVVSAVPGGAGGTVEHIDVDFNTAIDPASLTPDDVSIGNTRSSRSHNSEGRSTMSPSPGSSPTWSPAMNSSSLKSRLRGAVGARGGAVVA